ncbi:MAG: Hsp20/alpha crystallin family protein [Lentisphaerae bacterium]|nr:Hsp20/alpha crystallin family protein [Lentisphaerota bacterium]
MNEDKHVQKAEEATLEQPRDTRTDTIFVPEVDITEDAESIYLRASVPGADRDAVDISVENNVLTLEAQSRAGTPPAGYELVGQEYGVGKFRRSFTLSDQVDVPGIKARVAHGLLELTIPKREEVKTRKIAIEA